MRAAVGSRTRTIRLERDRFQPRLGNATRTVPNSRDGRKSIGNCAKVADRWWSVSYPTRLEYKLP